MKCPSCEVELTPWNVSVVATIEMHHFMNGVMKPYDEEYFCDACGEELLYEIYSEIKE